MHKHWTYGILPEAGGLMDQPAALELVLLATDLGVIQGGEVRREIDKRKQEMGQRTKAGFKGRTTGARRGR